MSNCLKASRVASGLRQEDIAKHLNIATGTVSTFEGNVEQIRLRDFKRWFNLCSDEGKAVIREYLRTSFFNHKLKGNIIIRQENNERV